MDREFIKDLLEDRQSNVYSFIIKKYREQISSLGPTLFQIWLSKEIGINKDKINVSSLNSAFTRFKKSVKQTGHAQPINPVSPVEKVNLSTDTFKFSSADEIPKNSRTKEL